MTKPARGHRALPHTADVIVEAWGPDLATCLEEAVAGLAGLYADASKARIVDRRPVRLPAAPAPELLLDIVDEVIFALDTGPTVPVDARITRQADGGVEVDLGLASRNSVTPGGAAPKGVSRSDLQLDQGPERVHCRFLVDV